LRGKRVLVVEDEPIVAMAAEDMIAELGAEVVGSASRLDEAMALASSVDVDFALLDVNLNGERSDAVAGTLRARSIPFAFATGYGEAGVAAAFAAPVLQKPYALRDVERALTQLAEQRA